MKEAIELAKRAAFYLTKRQNHRALPPATRASRLKINTYPGLTPQALRCRLVRRLND